MSHCVPFVGVSFGSFGGSEADFGGQKFWFPLVVAKKNSTSGCLRSLGYLALRPIPVGRHSLSIGFGSLGSLLMNHGWKDSKKLTHYVVQHGLLGKCSPWQLLIY